jgi:hypothetical protein
LSGGRPRRWLFALLIAGFIACMTLWYLYGDAWPFARDWLPNIGADFVGVAFVVLVVDWLLAADRERSRRPVREICVAADRQRA